MNPTPHALRRMADALEAEEFFGPDGDWSTLPYQAARMLRDVADCDDPNVEVPRGWLERVRAALTRRTP